MAKNDNTENANPMWGGHYDLAPDEIMEEINASIDFDKRLYSQDIRGSIAHCEMLAKKKIITQDEANEIISGLKQIKKDIFRGKFQFKPSLEDIHMNIEARLNELAGGVSGKLHTARSRNDQVATDFKLYIRDSIDYLDDELKNLQKSFIERADEHFDTVMPGFTHLQTAQPVTLGHHLMAYVEMFGRDRSRLADNRKRLNECPLGAAALAGTSFPIDRKITSKNLGFDRATANSIDSVSDRDFAIEFLSNISMIAMHLSRFSEEIVIWASAEFNFIRLSERFTTGSSIMPQKRNPDAAELVRAKTGRVYGALISLLTVMKGLSLTYSKDMQEDKEPVFEAIDNLNLCIRATRGIVDDFTPNKERMNNAAARGYSTATDLADWLVQNTGKPFRECHKITGKIVKLAEQQACRLDEVELAEMQQIEPTISNSVFDVLNVESSVKSRTSYGGTAPANVKKAIKEAKKKYDIK